MTIKRQAEDLNARSPDGFGSETANRLVEARDLKPGEVIERYKILKMVGRGAIGSVYEVEQIYMHRRFALKTLNPIAHTDVALRRFQQEAKAAGRLEHPNLVRAVDFGMIDESQPFLVMDFIEGQTLSDYLKTHARMPVNDALEIFIPVCFALGYAHSEGVIHRDIKPSNIVLTRQDNKMVPKVVDFGIAKVDQAEGLTRTGEVFGTPLYMSPEQCAGIKVDHRTDIYALGCVLFEVLTGAPPLRGPTALETMMQHSTVAPPSLKEASFGLEFPEDLEKIVCKMLAKDPDQRYQDILYAADDLAGLQQGRPINVVPPKPRAHAVAAPSRKDNRSMSNVLLVLAGAIACGAVIMLCQLITRHDIQQTESDTSAARQRRQDKETVETTAPTNPALLDPHIVFPKHYSHVENGERIFKFPDVRGIGSLNWFEGKTQQNRPDLQNALVRVPLNADYTWYEPACDTMYLGARLADPFQDGDFDGLVWTPGQDQLEADQARAALAVYTKIRSLRYILLRDIISPAALDNMGKLPNLRWLVIDRPGQLEDAKRDDGQIAALLAQMPNLNGLRVFGLYGVNNVGPVLDQLSTSHVLQRLELRYEDLGAADITAISQMKDLEMLDYCTVDAKRPSVADCHRFWSLVAQMPKLQHLCIDQKYLGIARDGKPSPELLQDLKRVRQLRQFAIIPSRLDDKTATAEQKTPTAETRKRIKECLPPGCEFGVSQELYSTFIMNWFQITTADDAKMLR